MDVIVAGLFAIGGRLDNRVGTQLADARLEAGYLKGVGHKDRADMLHSVDQIRSLSDVMPIAFGDTRNH